MLERTTVWLSLAALAIVTACAPAPEPIRPEPTFNKYGDATCDPNPQPPEELVGTNVPPPVYLPPCCPDGYIVVQTDDGPICVLPEIPERPERPEHDPNPRNPFTGAAAGN